MTFIIPSIGRPTLVRALNSVIGQTLQKWSAIVLFDGVKAPQGLPMDSRIRYVELPTRLGGTGKFGNAGSVRNHGIKLASTQWVGFLDDDDILTADYLDVFWNYAARFDFDFLLMRMRKHAIVVFPPVGSKAIRSFEVGISFAVRRSVFSELGFQFEQGDFEDVKLLSSMVAAGLKHVVADEVTYIAT